MESNTKKKKRERLKHAFSRLRSSSIERTNRLNPSSSQESRPEPSRIGSDVETGGSLPTREKNQNVQPKSLWDLALQNLSEEERTAIVQNSSGSKLDVLTKLQIAVEKKRDACEEKKWKFEFHGRQIILRDLADKLIKHIDYFKQVGDIVVNFDPVHAALPWAGIRFVLQLAIAESQQMAALLMGLEKVICLINRCKIYEALHLHNKPSQQSSAEVETNMEKALVAIYSHVLKFLVKADQLYEKKSAKRILYAILNPTEVDGFVKSCERLETQVEIETRNCDSTYTREMNRETMARIKKLEQLLVNLEEPIVRVDCRVATMFERLNKSEQSKILQWISSIPYEDNHTTACQGRTIDTGQWLLEHPRYREWRKSSASMILWLHGFPGAGKTKLVSTVIDDLKDDFEAYPNDEALAYFYCDRNKSEYREPSLVLRSFIRQLSLSQSKDSIQQSVVQLYNQKLQSGFASKEISIDESHAILFDLVGKYPQVTLIVDALDECDKKTRIWFVNVLDSLVLKSLKPLKIFISSRPDRDIKSRFEGGPNVEIRATDNQDDIEKFIHHEIYSSPQYWRDQVGLDLLQMICRELVDRSQGMFQWVSLQISQLLDLYRPSDIHDRLGKLPETLKDAYDEIYEKIQAQKGSAPVIADRAFQWVMCSREPLSPATLTAAVCQDPQTDETDNIDIDFGFVLEACHHLIVVDQELNVCRFSHLSVQEYFEDHHWKQHETNAQVGKVCLSLLNDLQLSTSLETLEDEPPSHPKDNIKGLLKYARLHWMTHVHEHGEDQIDKRMVTLLMGFLGSMNESGIAYRNWHKSIDGIIQSTYEYAYKLPFPLNDTYFSLDPCSLSSLPIVIFKFHKILSEWWLSGFHNVNQQNESGHWLLVLASRSGCVPIVRYLLERGADVNAENPDGDNALTAASFTGHKAVVRLLLSEGANVNAQSGVHGHALTAASCDNYMAIVRLLLDAGANVNAQGGAYGHALVAASLNDHAAMVRLLLSEGADVNAQGGYYGNALTVASHYGYEAIVRLLLDEGADPNAESEADETALEAASSQGHDAIVQILLEHGAIDKRSKPPSPALGSSRSSLSSTSE